MNKYKYNIKSILNERKNIYYSFLVLLFAGIIFGSLFITILDEPDKIQVSEQIKQFFGSISNINQIQTLKSSLVSNIFSILFIWILGASGIGIIFIILFIFIKGFILGFSIGAITYTYGIKGLIISFVYLFPHSYLNIFLIFILSIKSFNLSYNFLKSLISKKSIDYRLFGKNYLKLLILILFFIILSSISEAFFSPILLSSIQTLY